MKIEKEAKEYALKTCQNQSMNYLDITENARATTKMSLREITEVSLKIKEDYISSVQKPSFVHKQIKTEFKEILSENWSTVQDLKGRTYYWNMETNKTQWERPT